MIPCGGSTEIGIASTAYAARDLDFDLVILSDATSTGKADNQRQFMTRILPLMARVRSEAEVVQMMGNTAGARAGS